MMGATVTRNPKHARPLHSSGAEVGGKPRGPANLGGEPLVTVNHIGAAYLSGGMP